MAMGIKILDASGNVIIDNLSRVGHLLGFVTIDAGNQSGSVSIPTLGFGTPFYIFEKFALNNTRPTIAFNTVAKTMTWTAGSGTYLGKIFYGVY